MADGDKVHGRLARLYQKPYQWLCEGKASNDECARVLMEALKKDLKNKGNLPVIISRHMAEVLIQAVNDNCRNSSVDWAALNIEFEKLVQQFNGPSNLKELTLYAGKTIVHDLRYGQELDVNNFSKAILERYMKGVYESEFKERIQLTSEHHAGVSEVILEKRIESMQSNIDTALSVWADKAVRDESVANLRMPHRQFSAIDLDENLLCAAK
jgi:hypothetical protein